MSLPYRWIPWFHSIFLQPMRDGGLDMSSDERIAKVACPILILHAGDDHIIPTALGRKLKVAAEMALRDVTMVEFEANRKFRHKHIWKAEELPEIVRRFTKRCESRKID